MYTYKLELKGQSVQNSRIQWKQTDKHDRLHYPSRWCGL